MSKYELITDLCESKVFRSRQALEKMGAVDRQNLLYSSMLGTIAGSLDQSTATWAKEYAARTAAFNNFSHFRPSATDLYVLMFASNQSVQDKGRVIRMLKGVSRGTVNKAEVQQVLLKLERTLPGLDSRLRTARRAIVSWETTSASARQAAVQNIILSMQNVSRRAEVLPYMKTLKGGPRGFFGKSSKLKKAAAVAGAGLAGFWLGRKLYDPKRKFTFGHRREAIELGASNMLAEDRATQLAYIAQKLPEHPAVEKVISVNYINDGISAFVRTKDGNAYEFEIRPARFAKGHEEKRGVTEDIVDMTDEPCRECGKGVYKETSIFDDMDGVLHCSECNHKIVRHLEESRVAEAVSKIACLDCDEVSTEAAWEKSGGFCPKCKDSNQGVAEGWEYKVVEVEDFDEKAQEITEKR